MTSLDAMRIFIPTTITFLIGIGMTPFVTHYLYRHRMWKQKGGKIALDGKPADTFNALHETKEVGTPRFGGFIVWGSVLLCATLLSILSNIFPESFGMLAFISASRQRSGSSTTMRTTEASAVSTTEMPQT